MRSNNPAFKGSIGVDANGCPLEEVLELEHEMTMSEDPETVLTNDPHRCGKEVRRTHELEVTRIKLLPWPTRGKRLVAAGKTLLLCTRGRRQYAVVWQ